MEGFFINLLNGLSFGAVLFLLAAGLSLILGLMGVLNLAHGALFLFGAYVGVSLSRHEVINESILRYMNRLSDLFFILARYMNRQQSVPEVHPDSAGSQD